MKHIPGDQRGFFLVQTVVLVALLAMMAILLIELTFARATVVAKVSSRQAGGAAAQAAQSRVLSCLQGSQLGQSNCDASACSSCFPTSVNGLSVAVTVSGSPPLCNVRIQVLDP